MIDLILFITIGWAFVGGFWLGSKYLSFPVLIAAVRKWFDAK